MNPEDLDLTWVRPRPETFDRCGKDITRFILEKDDGKDVLVSFIGVLCSFQAGIHSFQVGGVRYQAFSEDTLGLMIENHRRVTVRGVRRREAMEAWAYGSMTGGGARQPSGGLKGDVYGPYARHHGETPEDIRALFRHAAVFKFCPTLCSSA